MSSALIMDNEISFGKHLLVAVWDPDIVLDYLSNLECDIPLKNSSGKLVILLCLLSEKTCEGMKY